MKKVFYRSWIAKHVLVIVDVQNDFVDGALGTKEAVEILPYVKEEISKKYDDVFVTFDTHEENYLDTLEGKMLPVKHCIRYTEGWKLNRMRWKMYHIFLWRSQHLVLVHLYR